jgi:hypothetical protein
MASPPRGKQRQQIDTAAYLRMVARLLANGGKRVADEDPDDLRQLLHLREVLDLAIVEAVRGLRASGCTWQDIGDAIGTTRQAAIMRWSKRV